MILKEEYGIVMIKPDGMAQEGFFESLLWRFKIYDLQIIEKKQVILTREQVRDTISTNFNVKEYLDYISEKELIVLLLKGENCIAKIIDIKRKVRTKYGFSSLTMKNLLHSPDCGNEYYEHFKLLFPELKAELYGAYADMTIPFSNFENENKIIETINKSNVTKYAVLCTNKSEVLRVKNIDDENCFVGIIVETEYEGRLLSIISYIEKTIAVKNIDCFSSVMGLSELIQSTNDCGGITVLDYYDGEDYRELIQKLKDKGIDGVVVYDPRFSKEKVIELEILCEDDLNMLLVGGTHGILSVGSLGADKETFTKYIKRMNAKNDIKCI